MKASIFFSVLPCLDCFYRFYFFYNIVLLGNTLQIKTSQKEIHDIDFEISTNKTYFGYSSNITGFVSL